MISQKIENLKKENLNHSYFKFKDLSTLIIRELDSLESLGTLLNDLREIQVLILPKLDANDIYLDTLIEKLNPQFIFVTTKSKSEKVRENLKSLALHSNLIINEGKLVVSDRKYWRIYIIKK